MERKQRRKKENRWDDIDGGSAFLIPLTLLRHPNFTRLSAYGVKLLIDLARQYTGFNNGYLCASWALMEGQGWNSSHTVRKAMLECEHYQLIERTQQGSFHKPNLHALTWRRIDEKPQKPLDVGPTLKPSDRWKETVPVFEIPKPKPRKKRPRTEKKAA